MGKAKAKWTEERITRLVKEGRGRGTGCNYQPWLLVHEVSSLGRSRRIWSPKLGRTVHLLSDVEYNLFIALEWQTDVTDIREQFPLDRDITQTIARELGIRHPCYVGTTVPTVMTTDFMVTFKRAATVSLAAFNAKRAEEADDEVSLLKLEIQREYFARLGCPHHLVYHTQIPAAKVANIDWVRDALLKEGEVEPYPGYFDAMKDRMAADITSQPSKSVLVDYCTDFDRRFGAERGTGLRVAKMLISSRALQPDLGAQNLERQTLQQLRVAPKPTQLRAVGGT